MFQLESSAKKFDTVLVMLLFFLFASTAFILILLGIKQYKLTADAMNDNYEVRTATSYVTEKIRQNDTDLGIRVEDLNGIDALAMSEELEGNLYTTYIYYYDGYLRELFVSSDSVFDIESGQPIIEIGNMHIESLSDTSLVLTLTSTKGEDSVLYLATKSS